MRFGFKQPLVGEKRCVTTLITAAEETNEISKLIKTINILQTTCRRVPIHKTCPQRKFAKCERVLEL